MDTSYVERMKQRLATMRRVAIMSHDQRIVELVTEAADQLEEDIRSLEAGASEQITMHLEPPPEA